MKKRIFLKLSAVLLSCFAITVPPETSCNPFRPDPLTDAVVKADCILVGTVTDKKYEVFTDARPDRPGNWTYAVYTLSVKTVIKGDLAAKEIVFRQEGGPPGSPGPILPGPIFYLKDSVLAMFSKAGSFYSVTNVLWSDGEHNTIIISPGPQEMVGRIVAIMQKNNIPVVSTPIFPEK